MSLLHARRLLPYAFLLLLSGIAVPALAQVSRVRATSTAGGTPSDAGREVRRASCVLQLDFDANRGSRGFDTQTLNALLTSTSLVDPAAEKTLNLSSDQWPRVVQIEVVPAGNSAVRLGVTITQDAQTKLRPDATRLLLGELASRARTAVDAAGSRQEKSRNERLAALEAESAAAQKELDKASAKLREARAAGEGERVIGNPMQSRIDRDSLEVNLRAQQARLVVLEAERQRVTSAAATRPAAGGAPQPSPWPDLIAARERIVALVREQKAAGTQTELALLQAEASLAEARVLAVTGRSDRRESDPADRLQAEIVSLKASIAETEARLAAINERFPKPSTQTTTPPVDVEQLRQDEGTARNRMNELRQLVEQLRRDTRNAPVAPTLIILDGKSGS